MDGNSSIKESAVLLIFSHALFINLLSCLPVACYGLLASVLFIGGLSLYRWSLLMNHLLCPLHCRNLSFLDKIGR